MASSTRADNAIVFPTWFVGTHADLEWLIGDGKPLDTTRYFVVVPSMFGNGLSSSPSNTPRHSTAAVFPAVSIQDNVRAQHRLMTEQFGISPHRAGDRRLHGRVPGLSVGAGHPDLVERIAPCCGAARVSPHCYVFLAGAKAALEADPALKGGDYTDPPLTGLRALGRVWAGWALSQQFYRDGLYSRMGF